MRRIAFVLVLSISVSILSASAFASTTSNYIAEKSDKHQPPQVAIDACSDLEANDACSFTLDARTLDGICHINPDEETLACAPNGMPPPHHQPPQEAIDACASSENDDSCSFTTDAETISGVCRSGPNETTLACVPSPPQPPQEAIDACANLNAEDQCSFTVDSHSLSGICRMGPDDSVLACAPKTMERFSRPPPPQAAIDACADLVANNTCSFTIDSNTINGICHNGPIGELDCRPSSPPKK